MNAPTNEVLKRFLSGELSPDQAAAVASWVDADATAIDALRQTTTEEDELTSALRQVKRDDFTLNPEARRVIAALAAIPHSLGDYRIEGVLGEGGMGAVYLARDERLGRMVALKTMRPEIAARPGAKERFLREARAAARIEHDHVIPIWQVNEEAGLPFIAMPLLVGETLAARLGREAVLPLPVLLKIGREVAEGLAAAHARGLIHRDIKPANIWLEGDSESADPAARFRRTKILDFGLARPADSATHLTGPGAVLGTPGYMSPEQASGTAVDARSDLFSLGVLLYRMATGEQPFSGPTTLSILSQLAVHEPAAPSTKNPALPAALSELILKLLSKKPNDRPASARVVAEALQEITARRAEPIQSNHTNPGRERGRRTWIWVAAAAAAILMAAGGWFLQDILVVRDKDGKEVARVTVPPGGKVEVVESNPKSTPRPAVKTLAALTPAALVAAPTQLEGVQSWTIETIHPRGAILAADLSPDGQLFAAAGDDSVIRIWDTKTRQITKALHGHKGPIKFLAWFPDSHTLASGAAADGAILLWDTSAGKVLRTVGEYRGHLAALRPDGTMLATSLGRGIHVWNIISGKREARTPELEPGPSSLAWSPDGKTLAIGRHNTGQVVLWPIAQEALVPLPNKEPKVVDHIKSVAWSSDGKKLAAASNRVIAIWDVASRQLDRTMENGNVEPFQLNWTSEDKVLLFSARKGEFVIRRAYDALSGQVASEKAEGATQAHIVGYGIDGNGNSVWHADHGAVYLSAKRGDPRLTSRQHPPYVASWSRSGDKVAVLGPLMSVWQPGQGILLWSHEHQGPTGWGDYTVSAAFSHDDKWLATGSTGGGLWIFDVTSGQRLVEHQGHQIKGSAHCSLDSVAWSPNDKWIATAGDDKVVRVWEANPFRPLASFEGHENKVETMAWSPDGQTLASGARDGTVRLWNVAERKPLRTLRGNCKQVFALAWSPDGKRLVAQGNTPLLQLWSAETGETLPCRAAFSQGGKEHLRFLVWSSDGTTLTCSGVTGTRVYDTKTWELRREVAGNALSPDQSRYVTPDGYRLCETTTGRGLGSFVPLRGRQGLMIHANGHYRGSADASKAIVYVVQTDQGQETLTPEAFAKKYGWKNDPEQVRLTRE